MVFTSSYEVWTICFKLFTEWQKYSSPPRQRVCSSFQITIKKKTVNILKTHGFIGMWIRKLASENQLLLILGMLSKTEMNNLKMYFWVIIEQCELLATKYRVRVRSNKPNEKQCHINVNLSFNMFPHIVYVSVDLPDAVFARHGESSAAVRPPGSREIRLTHGELVQKD